MERKLHFANERYVGKLYGRDPANLDYFRERLGVNVVVRGDFVKLVGEDEKQLNLAEAFFREVDRLCREGWHFGKDEFKTAVDEFLTSPDGSRKIFKERIAVPGRKRFIVPKTKGQKEYVHAIKYYDIVFAVGPAGTGKTYLAMAMAVNALMEGIVSRIILTRPAVEAGEALGFLPGDLYEKVDPYLRPLYDALYDMMPVDKIQAMKDKGIIEVAPLAYMRGRTLNDSFVILDEAQNTTQDQMKMFLTRLGFDSKTVITGDITQIDLPEQKPSGLIHVVDVLNGIEGIKFVFFDETDVVRHELVTKIIKAYEEDRKRKSGTN